MSGEEYNSYLDLYLSWNVSSKVHLQGSKYKYYRSDEMYNFAFYVAFILIFLFFRKKHPSLKHRWQDKVCWPRIREKQNTPNRGKNLMKLAVTVKYLANRGKDLMKLAVTVKYLMKLAVTVKYLGSVISSILKWKHHAMEMVLACVIGQPGRIKGDTTR